MASSSIVKVCFSMGRLSAALVPSGLTCNEQHRFTTWMIGARDALHRGAHRCAGMGEQFERVMIGHSIGISDTNARMNDGIEIRRVGILEPGREKLPGMIQFSNDSRDTH